MNTLTPPRRKVVILGSTGSIGVSTLDVIGRFPERFEVIGLAAGRNLQLLAEQVATFTPQAIAVHGESEAARMRTLLPQSSSIEIHWGQAGLCRLADRQDVDIVVSAIVGAAGLAPTWSAIKAGKKVALANKETMVMAGELVIPAARASGALILPVDSEHSAIFQALAGQRTADVRRVILTASGGPFRNFDRSELANVTRAQALAHPNWRMGAKISVDSATLINKGLEAIEARWFFNLNWEQIAIHVHPQSIVHSLVEFIDGSILAQMGIPDMRLPIAYALSYPERLPLGLPSLDLPQTPPLSFSEPDPERFPCLALALQAGRRGGLIPAALNAANEEAVSAFLADRISFLDIHRVVSTVINRFPDGTGQPIISLDQVLETDRQARIVAQEMIKTSLR